MSIEKQFYKLFKVKADLASILKRYCCHGNVSYKFILTTIKFKTTYLITPKNNYCSDI